MTPTLREARLILPRFAWSGEPLDAAFKRLSDAFGGLTRYTGTGLWKNEHEEVWIVDVAYEQTTENDMILFDIAQKFREEAQQQEVYLRYGNGYVQMVDVHSIMSNGRPNCWYSPNYSGATDAINTLIDTDQTEGTRLSALQYLIRNMSEKGPSGLDWE